MAHAVDPEKAQSEAGNRVYKYLFGPVPSRRFGRSLGVDLTPFKTCSFDCVFCQLGRTTNLTMQRGMYVPMAAVTAEIEDWLNKGGQADQITLAGSGEPTLHQGFGEVIRFIKDHTDIPVALLTNGSMLHLSEVREAAALADTVKISLSAWDQESISRMNRPCAGLSFDQLVAGERQFRSEFNGRLWMEVFLLSGFNSDQGDVKKISALAREIRPDRIQLNTCIRPPAESFALAVSEQQMLALSSLFEPVAEMIADFSASSRTEGRAGENEILDMLRRRPCTSAQIAEVFGMHLNEVAKYIGKLMRTNQIKAVRRDLDVYYLPDTEPKPGNFET